jgi:hypothetical protein
MGILIGTVNTIVSYASFSPIQNWIAAMEEMQQE